MRQWRKFVRKSRRILIECCRGLAVLAIAAKLLVPVGYMPAAFAEGGPFMLCDSGLPEDLGAQHQDHAAGHMHADAAANDHGSHSHGEEPANDHSEWERCSLGGLAGLAAIATEWRYDFAIGAPERVDLDETVFLPYGAVLGFRSRAPPSANA